MGLGCLENSGRHCVAGQDYKAVNRLGAGGGMVRLGGRGG